MIHCAPGAQWHFRNKQLAAPTGGAVEGETLAAKMGRRF